MTSLGSFKALVADAPGWKEVDSPPASRRFGADADTGGPARVPEGFLPDRDFCLSVSALCRRKISSIVRRLSSFALSSSLLTVGVLLRLTPRFRALPKGPFSSGTRRWACSELMHAIVSDMLRSRLWREPKGTTTIYKTGVASSMDDILFESDKLNRCADVEGQHSEGTMTYSAYSNAQGSLRPVESNARSESGTAWTCMVATVGVELVVCRAALRCLVESLFMVTGETKSPEAPQERHAT